MAASLSKVFHAGYNQSVKYSPCTKILCLVGGLIGKGLRPLGFLPLGTPFYGKHIT